MPTRSVATRTIRCIKKQKVRDAIERSSLSLLGSILTITPKSDKDAEIVCSHIEDYTHDLAKELGIRQVTVVNSRLLKPFSVRCCSERF